MTKPRAESQELFDAVVPRPRAAQRRGLARVRFLGLAFLVQFAILGFVTVALLEGLVAFSFRYPAMSPLPLRLLKFLHVQFDRNTIQVMPECARYDPEVTYTLRPGACTFGNREYENAYRINSLGVRDDDPSLQRPDTVVLGDSVAMGWGVEQEQAFPSVYEKATGRRTLNAAISSFGTVRALRLLTRIDRSAVRDLVIQYSENDYLENAQFAADPAGFKVLSETEYKRTVEAHRESLAYYPGKYAVNVLVQLRAMLRDGPPAPADASRRRDAEAFFAVLERSPVDLAPLRLTVLSLDSGFIAAAREIAGTSSVDWIRAIRWLDVGGVASVKGSFYVLDDHPTAAGQAAIASTLTRALAERD